MDAVSSFTENKQEEEKMVSFSNENSVKDLKEEVDMKDSLTANGHESQQPEVVQGVEPQIKTDAHDTDDSDDSSDDDASDDSDDVYGFNEKFKSEETSYRSKKNRSNNEDGRVAMFKDRGLYLAAINGDLKNFKTILDGISTVDSNDDILSRLSIIGNTFIHVAAKHGNQDIVKFVASTKPSLVLAKNFNAETALHLAAKGGDEPMVIDLLGILSHNETEKRDLLMAKNKMGNTALHVAVLNGWESIATYLIAQDSELSYHLNEHGESAIYLAAKAGLVECVSSILTQCTDESRLNKLFENKSPIQAAIEKKDIVVLKAIFTTKPGLIQVRDSKGRNPLHIAALLGHLEAARYLLPQYALNATRRDGIGRLPIHLAALQGHVDVIRFLLQDFPQPEELLDMAGRNILHNAALCGRYNVVSFVLNNPNLGSLINMKDVSGDTPLHIASKEHYPKIVSTLTWDKRVDTMAVNKKGRTALDDAEKYSSYHPTLIQRLTWAALKAASDPRKSDSDSGKMVDVRSNHYKERVNTLLVVATLVATVTFAAGFTMPGGYISSETDTTNLGMATMSRHKVFQVFVLCDTIAMYTSILVVTALIWAQLGDTTLVITALELAAPLLGVALVMMSVAFTAGVTIVVSKLKWLQISLLAMSISFVAFLLLLLLPLCAPISSRNRILRYLSYYPFCMLVLISRTKREIGKY